MRWQLWPTPRSARSSSAALQPDRLADARRKRRGGLPQPGFDVRGAWGRHLPRGAPGGQASGHARRGKFHWRRIHPRVHGLALPDRAAAVAALAPTGRCGLLAGRADRRRPGRPAATGAAPRARRDLAEVPEPVRHCPPLAAGDGPDRHTRRPVRGVRGVPDRRLHIPGFAVPGWQPPATPAGQMAGPDSSHLRRRPAHRPAGRCAREAGGCPGLRTLWGRSSRCSGFRRR